MNILPYVRCVSMLFRIKFQYIRTFLLTSKHIYDKIKKGDNYDYLQTAMEDVDR